MTYTDRPPRRSPGPGPGAFVGFVVAALATPTLPFFAPFGFVVGAVALLGAIVLVTREDASARGLGAGVLGGMAVGALLFGACFAIVASSI